MIKFYIQKSLYDELIEKGYGKKDLSKLVRKQIIDKNGHRRTVYVNPDGNKTIAKPKKIVENKTMDSHYITDSRQKFDNIIKEIVSKGEFEFYGIRADSSDLYKIGEIANKSHQLYQDAVYNEDDELAFPEGKGIYEGYFDAGELDGTCALEINPDDIKNEAERVFGYNINKDGYFIYLIGSNDCNGGNDPNEIIMENAKVLAKLVIKKEEKKS